MLSLRKLYYSFTPNQRLWIRKVVYWPYDLLKSAWPGEELQPRKGDIYIGSGDFVAIGHQQLDLLKRHITLQPTDTVLDVGSGIGRTAVPLTKFLAAGGQYRGFDVVKKGVDWCKANISQRYPHFQFTYVPLHNDLYNEAPESATDFVFPYESNYFDKVFLFSVFTHMQVPEIAQYLREIGRVLKPDGMCLCTFFLYDDDTADQISRQEGFQFPIVREGYRLLDDRVTGANVAIDDRNLHDMIAAAGLTPVDIVEGYWKSWIQKDAGGSFQDVVILRNS